MKCLMAKTGWKHSLQWRNEMLYMATNVYIVGFVENSYQICYNEKNAFEGFYEE